MSQHAARLSLAAAVVAAFLVTVLGTPARVSASHLPPPAEIVLRLAELPPGFEPVAGPAGPALLPDGLARQAVATYRREGEAPGMREVRQVVLAFDERDAAEYLARFQTLMTRHQGYVVAESGPSEFRLVRARPDETSAVVAVAHGEVLVVTTVGGEPGTVGPDDAARLTGIAVARMPTVEQTAAALSTEPGQPTLASAFSGPGRLNLPNQQDAARWPQPVAELPGPPSIGVVQQRHRWPAGDESLNALVPLDTNHARPPGWPADLVQFTRALEPLLNEFWTRALYMTDVDYHPPKLVVVAEGETVMTGCRTPAVSIGYCILDETIYVYEPMLRTDPIAGQDWRARDYVIPTVIAHEWGHHIQLLTNLIPVSIVLTINQEEKAPLIARQRELQADCYAGMFTRYARDRGWLTAGDLEEAREAMMRAGDTDVEHFDHHGTPEQRREWFMRGYHHYAFSACDPW